MANLKTINSIYFTLDEFVYSPTAIRCGIDNTPSPAVVANLQYGVSMILDPLRSYMQEPIIITSGYRCRELNEVVRGVKNSWHMLGNAADIRVNGKEDAAKKFAFLKKCPSVDTVLFEHSGSSQWLHVQWDVSKTPRHRADFNYIAKLIVVLCVLCSSMSCRSSSDTFASVQRDSVTSTSSVLHTSSFFVVRDSAFADILPLLVTPLPDDSATLGKLKKNAVMFASVRTSSTFSTTAAKKVDSIRCAAAPASNKNEPKTKSCVKGSCRFGIYFFIFLLLFCLFVRFRKKIANLFVRFKL